MSVFVRTLFLPHDDFIKWKHFRYYWSFIRGFPWILLTKASDAELWCLLISAWTNGCVNNRDAVNLRRHRAHYDMIVIDWHRCVDSISRTVDLGVWRGWILSSIMARIHRWFVMICRLNLWRTSTITMTSLWARWRLKSKASPLFTQRFIQAQITKKHQSSASLAFVRGIPHSNAENVPNWWRQHDNGHSHRHWTNTWEAVKYSWIRHAKCSVYIAIRTFVNFVAFFALLIPAWKYV